jgi:hypothetical protein
LENSSPASDWLTYDVLIDFLVEMNFPVRILSP